MFRFHDIELVHWDFWQRCTIPLDSEIVTVVGPNGSGKTTLLDALRTLLAISCSSGRDYKRYVRRADQPYGWLRALVSNPRRPSGQLAFWPITEPQVTLLCQIRKKGGEWERRYGISGGAVQIEEAEASERVNWVGVRQYESQLENAGLTRAIKRVLSLDQGHTDKLCEYSGRQLTELVFQVFGDQEVLDNYQQARQEQATVERELSELNTRLAQLGTQLEEAKAHVRSYDEYQSLLKEIADLQGQWLPRVAIAELADAIKGSRRQLQGAKRELLRMASEISEKEMHAGRVKESLGTLEAEGNAAQTTRGELRERLSGAHEHLTRARAVLDERDRLSRMVREQARGIDAAGLSNEASALRDRQFHLDKEIEQAERDIDGSQARIAALESGRTLQPDDVQAFRDALREAGIAHVGLSEIIEVTREDWHHAVEAVLRGLRHVVVLDNPEDQTLAWKKGEVLRYRHFITSSRADAMRSEPGTLADCVRFRAEPPAWVASLLNEIRCVETVDEGSRLPEHQEWISRGGYHRSRRGGRYIGGDDYFFGKAAVTKLKERTQELRRNVGEWNEERHRIQRRLGEIQALMGGIDAARDLLARSAEFSKADAQLPSLEAAHEAARNGVERCERVLQDLTSRLRALEREGGAVEGALDTLRQDYRKAEAEYRRAREEQLKRLQALRSERRGKPRSWLSADALAEAKEKYGARETLEREIQRLERRRADEGWIKDPACVDRRDKYDADYKELSGRIEAQYSNLEIARASTERARGQYINVLKGTLRRYADNIRRLGELAGIEVSVGYPVLANDDVTLSQAGLDIRFDFDKKGLIGLNDGEGSGGQQVMKSMILLVGLMMDDAAGGFVFIDEPFAHLDIFNIDKVGAFLEATRSQYILTTPNTHNVNVFKPSDITLVTQKRRPGDRWAPPVAFLRRAKDVATAG